MALIYKRLVQKKTKVQSKHGPEAKGPSQAKRTQVNQDNRSEPSPKSNLYQWACSRGGRNPTTDPMTLGLVS